MYMRLGLKENITRQSRALSGTGRANPTLFPEAFRHVQAVNTASDLEPQEPRCSSRPASQRYAKGISTASVSAVAWE